MLFIHYLNEKVNQSIKMDFSLNENLLELFHFSFISMFELNHALSLFKCIQKSSRGQGKKQKTLIYNSSSYFFRFNNIEPIIILLII